MYSKPANAFMETSFCSPASWSSFGFRMRCEALLTLAFLAVLRSPVASGWRLVWSDEFDGWDVDHSKWSFQNGDGCGVGICGWGNNEQQWYQQQNAYVRNGVLVIEAKRENAGGKQYTSARLRTHDKGDWKFGKVEVRAKSSTGQGFWSAIWMLPSDGRSGWPNSGEIDIMENIGREPSVVHQVLHYGRAWNDKNQKGATHHLHNGQRYADDFHTFTVEWRHDEVKFYVDGQHKITTAAHQIHAEKFHYPFNAHFYLVLNLAVGGHWPGYPDGSTHFPQRMEVDYVRVYQE